MDIPQLFNLIHYLRHEIDTRHDTQKIIFSFLSRQPVLHFGRMTIKLLCTKKFSLFSLAFPSFCQLLPILIHTGYMDGGVALTLAVRHKQLPARPSCVHVFLCLAKRYKKALRLIQVEKYKKKLNILKK